MTLNGELPVYWTGETEWAVFTDRLETYFTTNAIPEHKKHAILLFVLDDSVYMALRDACHPQLPKDKTYGELLEMLNRRFIVCTSVFRNRVWFYKAEQEPCQPISSWYSYITCLAVECKFGEQFNTILLDRFISGIRNTVVLDRLCEEDEHLTLEKAYEIAKTMESTAAGSRKHQSGLNLCRINNTVQFNSTLGQAASTLLAMDHIGYVGSLWCWDTNGYPTVFQGFIDQLEAFTRLNDIHPDKRKILLLTALHDRMYTALRDRCHPQPLTDKSYEELVEMTMTQFIDRRSIFIERKVFYDARQEPNESITGWYLRLKNLSVDCRFGERFDAVLLDRFVSGLRDKRILDRLFEEDENLTIQRAMAISTALEKVGK